MATLVVSCKCVQSTMVEGTGTVGLNKTFPVWFVLFRSPLTFVPFISRSVSV